VAGDLFKIRVFYNHFSAPTGRFLENFNSSNRVIYYYPWQQQHQQKLRI